MNTEQERAAFETACRKHAEESGYDGHERLERDGDGYADLHTQAAWWAWQARAALQSQDREGWKEAAIAWEVCASLHRDYAKGRDPLFKTRQSDFVKHAEDSRLKALSQSITKDRVDAERYRWLRDSDGLHDLPYEDHGLGPEFPSGEALDAAIDHARRAEGEA